MRGDPRDTRVVSRWGWLWFRSAGRFWFSPGGLQPRLIAFASESLPCLARVETMVADRMLGLPLAVIHEAENSTHTNNPARKIAVG